MEANPEVFSANKHLDLNTILGNSYFKEGSEKKINILASILYCYT